MTGYRLKPQQRGEQLLDTGAALFGEKPYEDVCMGDIASRAGVSRATLYHYFPNKRDFYAAIFKRASKRMMERVAAPFRSCRWQNSLPADSRRTSNLLSIIPLRQSRSIAARCRTTRRSSPKSSTSWAAG